MWNLVCSFPKSQANRQIIDIIKLKSLTKKWCKMIKYEDLKLNLKLYKSLNHVRQWSTINHYTEFYSHENCVHNFLWNITEKLWSGVFKTDLFLIDICTRYICIYNYNDNTNKKSHFIFFNTIRCIGMWQTIVFNEKGTVYDIY
jgi:hypothetical protein